MNMFNIAGKNLLDNICKFEFVNDIKLYESRIAFRQVFFHIETINPIPIITSITFQKLCILFRK